MPSILVVASVMVRRFSVFAIIAPPPVPSFIVKLPVTSRMPSILVVVSVMVRRLSVFAIVAPVPAAAPVPSSCIVKPFNLPAMVILSSA